MKEESKVDYATLAEKVYSKKGGDIYLGGVKIDEVTKGLLEDQAFIFKNSNLYEILDATVTNEAINLLLQTNTIEHLQYAKALSYWNTIFKKIISGLSK